MLQRCSLFSVAITVLLCCLGSSALANPITYNVSVNTSSMSGTAGSLDFNFNPGPLVTQTASLQILSFVSNGSLSGSPMLTGDATGVLPAGLTFDNGTGFNDYFGDFTFGSRLSFQISLYGPALSSPDGVSTSGSAFAFSMFSDAAGTIPVLTTDTTDGFALTIDVNLNGTTTVTNFSPQTDVESVVTGVPEPRGLALVGMAVVVLGTLRLQQRHIENWIAKFQKS